MESSQVYNRCNGAVDMSRGRDAKVFENILQTIGNTPLVRLNRIPKDNGLECEIYAKCEFMNPGGSIKDRMAVTMVMDAERAGRAHLNDLNNNNVTRFVEPTSGNTGIGLALTAAVKGYKATIVTPDKNSEEKLNTMKLLGADVVQTPSAAKHGAPDHYLQVVRRLMEADPDANVCLDQFKNPVNPETHEDHTALEILDALGTVDMAVMGVGTGGTITGVARRFKRQQKCTIVAVDPLGSVIWGKEMKSFLVEGIGGDSVPAVLDKSCVDKVVAPTDYEALNMAREIIRKEGLLCGGSSGAAMFAALKVAKELNLGAGKKVVVVLPDGIRNYMTKFVCDQWMEAHLFKEPPIHTKIEWWNHPLSDLDVDTSVPHINLSSTCKEAIAAMGSDHSVAIVVDDNGLYKGATSKNQLRRAATNPKKEENLNLNALINKYLINDCFTVVANQGSPTVGLVSRILDITSFVVKLEKIPSSDSKLSELFKPKGIITSEMVWQYILKNQDQHRHH